MAKKKELNIDFKSLENASIILQVLGSSERLKLLKVLDEEGKIYVGKLALKLGKEQSVVSSHLTKLKAIGIVKVDRKVRLHPNPSMENYKLEKSLFSSDKEIWNYEVVYHSKEKYYSINYPRIISIMNAIKLL